MKEQIFQEILKKTVVVLLNKRFFWNKVLKKLSYSFENEQNQLKKNEQNGSFTNNDTK